MKLPKSSGQPRNKFPIVIRRVHGHSMVPILPPKTLVLGWSWINSFKTGDVIIFQHADKEKIKRIKQVLGDGSLYVVGEHLETSTDSRHFGAIDPGTVIARVIWPNVHLE